MKKFLLIAAVLFTVCGVFAKEYAFPVSNSTGKTIEICSMTLTVAGSSKIIKSSCKGLPCTLKDGTWKKIRVTCDPKSTYCDIEFKVKCDGEEYEVCDDIDLDDDDLAVDIEEDDLEEEEID